jgi:hypothetical protein
VLKIIPNLADWSPQVVTVTSMGLKPKDIT